MDKVRIEYPNLWYVVEYTKDGNSVKFKVFEATTLAMDDSILDVEDEPQYDGWVKWDGCVNWQTTPNHYAHFCEKGMIENFGKLFLKIYEQAGIMGCDIK